MFGSIDYFTNYFKSCIMNNLFVESPVSLLTTYYLLKDEILKSQRNEGEKVLYLQNLESAYMKVNKDLLEWEEAMNGN